MSTAHRLAVVVLVAAAGSAAWQSAREWRQFVPAAIGDDEPSQYVRRLGPLLAHLPPGAVVGYVDDLDFPDAEQERVRSHVCRQFAEALHRQLRSGISIPDAAIPGLPSPAELRVLMGIIEERYRNAHPDALTHDVPTMAANVLQIWLDIVRVRRLGNVQFTLAPHRVRPDVHCEWVVGDFAPGFAFAALAERLLLDVVVDAGAGAVLFRARR